MPDYTFTENSDIEVRVDFSRPETSVDYRFIGEDWTPSPFQSADVNHLSADNVLTKIDEYLNSQS